MAKCFNRNTPEYQSLIAKYKSNVGVDSLIESWQDINSSDMIPSTVQVDKLIRQKKVAFNLKKKNFQDSLYGALYNLGFISKFNDKYYVNVTARGFREGSPNVSEINKVKIEKLLNLWGLSNISSTNNYSFRKTNKTYEFTLSLDPENSLPLGAITDKIERSSSDTNVANIISHLESMFPQLEINIATRKQAEEYYKSLPKNQQRKIDFNKVRSFYHRGKAFIIEGSLDIDTAVEEVLHPFVDAIYLENNTLFENLYSESQAMFPKLQVEIEAAYSNRRGFTPLDRKRELVTQALSRHFRKEYEEQPTNRWANIIQDVLKFFLNVVQDLSQFITGKRLVFQAKDLRPTNNLSSIARILNTNDIC